MLWSALIQDPQDNFLRFSLRVSQYYMIKTNQVNSCNACNSCQQTNRHNNETNSVELFSKYDNTQANVYTKELDVTIYIALHGRGRFRP